MEYYTITRDGRLIRHARPSLFVAAPGIPGGETLVILLLTSLGLRRVAALVGREATSVSRSSSRIPKCGSQ
jgi:hypothetical protein